MPRRIDAGPALAALGALLLLVALFLDWFGGASAWAAFEVVDLLLAGIAVAALLAVAGRGVDRRWLPVLGALALLVVAVQLLEPPPGARDDRETGAWLALAGAALLALGAVLATAAVSVSVQVRAAADHPRRRRVSAVDRRVADEGAVRVRPSDPATDVTRVDTQPVEEQTRIAAVDRRPDARGASSSLFAPVTDDVETTQPMPTGEQPAQERP